MKRYLLIFKGHVQGVGFRYTVYELANSLSLTGHVKNLTNGNVEVEIQGQEEDIDSFIKDILKPRHFIEVEDYHIKQLPIIEEEDFKVTH